MGLLYGENCIILTSTVFAWIIRVTDGQTDRQADGIAIAYARLAYMLSRAKTDCCSLVTSYNCELRWCNSLRYLGVYMISSRLQVHLVALSVIPSSPLSGHLLHSLAVLVGLLRLTLLYSCLKWNAYRRCIMAVKFVLLTKLWLGPYNMSLRVVSAKLFFRLDPMTLLLNVWICLIVVQCLTYWKTNIATTSCIIVSSRHTMKQDSENRNYRLKQNRKVKMLHLFTKWACKHT